MATQTQTTIYTAATPVGGSAPRTYLNKTFYDRKLLENAKTQLHYAEFGQKKPIPRNSGKTVEFRKWNLFDPDAVVALTEGETPNSQDIGQTKIEATVSQYGAFVEVSDLLDLTAYDPVIGDTSELLGEQMGVKIDHITRDIMTATTNKQFAGGRASAANLTATDYLTVDEIRKAVRTLKNNKARMFGNGKRPHFICICDPYATYDLQSDALWQDVSKYSNAEQIYQGEIGRLFGVVFVESTESIIDAKTATNPVSSNTDVHHTLVFGESAYGIVDIDGSGTMEIIVKPHGSSGTADPLNQRATIGAKVMAYTAVILQPLWLIDIEHAVHA
jgi:N4-gp56 family major capsid protein